MAAVTVTVVFYCLRMFVATISACYLLHKFHKVMNQMDTESGANVSEIVSEIAKELEKDIKH
jgi:hypothetical protein